MWFSKTLRGDVAKRRSHIWMTGRRSSSEANTNWVATSGCQSIPEQCIWNHGTNQSMKKPKKLKEFWKLSLSMKITKIIRKQVQDMSVSFYIFITQNCRTFSSNSTADKANFSELEKVTLELSLLYFVLKRPTLLLWSLILMMGSFFLRSHTTAFPLGLAEARMCWTCLFQDTTLMSSAGWKKEATKGDKSSLAAVWDKPKPHIQMTMHALCHANTVDTHVNKA